MYFTYLDFLIEYLTNRIITTIPGGTLRVRIFIIKGLCSCLHVCIVVHRGGFVSKHDVALGIFFYTQLFIIEIPN